MKTLSFPVLIPVTILLLLCLSYFPKAFGCNRTPGCPECDRDDDEWRRKRAVSHVDTDTDVGSGDSSSRQDVEMYNQLSQFFVSKSADGNPDVKLDIAEAVNFLTWKNPAHVQEKSKVEIERAFRGLDKNGDGFLTRSEINKF